MKVYRLYRDNIYFSKIIMAGSDKWIKDHYVSRWWDRQGREYFYMAGFYFREKDVTLWTESPPAGAVDILGRKI